MEVISVEYIKETDDFVYDLETEIGYFQSGICEIIVHNTDSLMVRYNINLPKNPTKEPSLKKPFTSIK